MSAFVIKILVLFGWLLASITLILTDRWLSNSEIGNSTFIQLLILFIGVAYCLVCLWRRLHFLVIPMNILVMLTFIALVASDSYLESIMLLVLWFSSSFQGGFNAKSGG